MKYGTEIISSVFQVVCGVLISRSNNQQPSPIVGCTHHRKCTGKVSPILNYGWGMCGVPSLFFFLFGAKTTPLSSNPAELHSVGIRIAFNIRCVQ